MFLLVNFVAIATTFFVSCQDSGILEVGNDTDGRTLRDPDLVSHIPHAGTGVLRKADQGMRVVTQEVPRRCGLVHSVVSIGFDIHELKNMIYESCLFSQLSWDLVDGNYSTTSICILIYRRALSRG